MVVTPLRFLGFYYRNADQHVGPVSGDDINRLVALGKLSAADSISEGWRGEEGVRFFPRSRKQMRVLIVDDSKDSADSCAMLVTMYGHGVEVAYDGPSAVRLALAYQPDVVLLDLQMPAMTGFEVALRLVRQSTVGKPLIVAVTGYGEKPLREQWDEMGFGEYLLKPVASESLKKLLMLRHLSLGKQRPFSRVGLIGAL